MVNRFFILILFCMLFITNNILASKILNNKPTRGYFFYECPEGYKEVGVFKKCVPIPKEENVAQKEPIKEEPAKKEEPLQKEEIVKEETKDIFLIEKEKVEKETNKVANYDGESFVFPINEEAKRVPALANFLMHPENKEYAENYLSWQYKYMMHLQKIGFALSSTNTLKGHEIYPIKGYAANEVESIYNKYNQKALYREKWQSIKEKIGLIYFYSTTCPVCQKQTPIVDAVVKQYGFSIRGVVYDGKIDDTVAFESINNPGLYQKFNITQVPTLIAVYSDGDKYDIAGISVGIMPADNIVAKVLEFAKLKGVVKGNDLSVSKEKRLEVSYEK